MGAVLRCSVLVELRVNSYTRGYERAMAFCDTGWLLGLLTTRQIDP